MIKKIISGGQSGVEIAALDAAIKLDIPHAGWCYKGRRVEDGVLDDRYNVNEIGTPSYFERLEKNIVESDGIVILTYGQLIMGSRAVKDLASRLKRPCLSINLTDCSINHATSSIRKWIGHNEIEAVYFTGSKQIGESMIYAETVRLIEGIFRVEREQDILPGFQSKDDEN